MAPPLITTTGTSSAYGYAPLNSNSSGPTWIGVYARGTTSTPFIAVDNSNNVFVNSAGTLLKIAIDGSLTSQKSNTLPIGGILYSASENAIYSSTTGAASFNSRLTKVNATTYAQIASVEIGNGSSSNSVTSAGPVYVNSAGTSVYCAVTYSDYTVSTYSYIGLSVFNSTFGVRTLETKYGWSNSPIGGQTHANVFGGGFVFYNNNFYFGGQSNNVGSSQANILKCNTSGSFTCYGFSGTSSQSSGLIVDGSGYLYFRYSNSSGYFLAKVQDNGSSYTTIWARQFTVGAGTVYQAGGSTTDLNGNSYLPFVYTNGGSSVAIILKYDASGNLVWQRSIDGGTATINIGNALAKGNVVYVSLGIGNNSVICKLPSDGSGTGSYTIGGQSITYATVSTISSASASPGNPVSITAPSFGGVGVSSPLSGVAAGTVTTPSLAYNYGAV